MSKGQTNSRKQRRLYAQKAGFLQVKNMFGKNSEEGRAWYDKMAADGKEAHDIHTNNMNDKLEHEQQLRLNIAKENWKVTGYDETEIAMLEEAFSIDTIKNKETFQADRKEVKRLRRTAKASLKNRKDANS